MPNEIKPNDHVIIEITSSVNDALYSAINSAIGKAHPAIKSGLYLMSNTGGATEIAIASDQDKGRETAEFIGSVVGGFIGFIGGGGFLSFAFGTVGSQLGGSIGKEIYDAFISAKEQAEQDATINTPDWIDEAIISELNNNPAVNNEIAKLKNNEYYTKLEDYQAQLKAIIEQDLPPEELAALQQEINLFKSAYTDKASSYQQWHEDYTNYQDFKAEYDNWQQEDTTWRAEYEALTSQTQLAESEKDTAQQNYDTWNTQYQEWHADYVQSEEHYPKLAKNY